MTVMINGITVLFSGGTTPPPPVRISENVRLFMNQMMMVFAKPKPK